MLQLLVLLFCLFIPAELSAQPAGCTTTSCPGGALPSGYFFAVGNQIQDGFSNKVRIASASYVGLPTAIPTVATLQALRTAGFNTIKLNWRDRSLTLGGGLDSGCDTQAHLDTCVSNAAAANMKVILTHIGNEIPSGTSSTCFQYQANGLWFDKGGSSGNDDGCGDGSNVTYAAFKTDIVNLMAHYVNNPTVIGYEFHHHPLVVGTFTGAGGTATGHFSTSKGNIIDPNGVIFVPRGLNIQMADIIGSGCCSTSSGNLTIAQIQAKFPGVNYIRVWNDGLDTVDYTNTSTLGKFITAATNAHIVYQFSSYSANGIACDTTSAEGTWLQARANYYATNDYVWVESQNECLASDPTITTGTLDTEHKLVYAAVRAVAPNKMVILGSAQGNAAAPWYAMDTNIYTAMTNIAIDIHMYANQFVAAFGSMPTTQAAANSDATTMFNAWMTTTPLVPVFSGEFGNSSVPPTIDDPNNYTTLGTMNAVSLTPNSSPTFGLGIWLWCWPPDTTNGADSLLDGCPTGSPTSTTGGLTSNYGIPVQTAFAAATARSPTTGGNPPVNWGGGGDTDIAAACADIANAVYAVNPGVIEFCDGPVNATANWLNGVALTTGSGTQDLTAAGMHPITGPVGKVAYATDLYPTNVKGVTPDSGFPAVNLWNTAWGYLVTNDLAPVWISETGCSCDNTNGNQTDDLAFMNTFVPYVNGTTSGGISYLAGQQALPTDWWAWGNTGSNPNGLQNSDGTLKSAQQNFWYQLLYGAPAIPQPPQRTFFNPSDATSGITLSNNNSTALSTNALANAVRGTTGKGTGKFCYEFLITTITANTDVGLANLTFNLASGLGLGGDTNGIGFDPNSAGALQGTFFNNNAVNFGTPTSANGTKATICVDLDNELFWATTPEQVSTYGTGTWNNSVSCNPTVPSCGSSFAGLTCPCYIIFNDFDGGAQVTLNTTGPFNVPTPTGFLPWDNIANVGRAQIVFTQ